MGILRNIGAIHPHQRHHYHRYYVTSACVAG